LFRREVLVRAKNGIDDHLPLCGNAQVLLLQKFHEFLFGCRFLCHRHGGSIFQQQDKSTHCFGRVRLILNFELRYRTAKLAQVNIELINTGSELMLGSVLNTHHAWMSRQLANLGYLMTRQTTVADEGSVIQQVVRESLGRAELVITTGGLGPTSDDLTRNLIAELLGKKLNVDLNVLSQIENYFIARKRVMASSTKIQALVPEGAMVLANLHGTAPGLILEVAPGQFRTSEHPSFLVMLPGPPRELHPMFTRSVIPWLPQKFPRRVPFVCRIFKTTGMGESIIEETIAPSLKHLVDSGLEIGYCARIGEVEVRVVAHGDQAEEKANEASEIVQRLLEPYIFGLSDEQLEGVVIRLLSERKQAGFHAAEF
jgi:nicotinamide-nucleotide amidase